VSSAFAQNPDTAARAMTATRASGRITLDGALDEPDWASAPVARGSSVSSAACRK